MTTIILLLLAGIVLISSEILLPGMVLGVLGVCCMVVSIYFMYDLHGGFAAAFYALAAILGTFFIVFAEFKVFRALGFSRGLFLNTVSGGRSAEENPDRIEGNLVGEKGEAISVLAPTGDVVIAGQRYDAVSEDGLLKKGTDVEVIKQEKFRVFVRKV